MQLNNHNDRTNIIIWTHKTHAIPQHTDELLSVSMAYTKPTKTILWGGGIHMYTLKCVICQSLNVLTDTIESILLINAAMGNDWDVCSH